MEIDGLNKRSRICAEIVREGEAVEILNLGEKSCGNMHFYVH
jgi:hypothetical protein